MQSQRTRGKGYLETGLTWLVVVIHLHHSVLHLGNLVISEERKLHAHLCPVKLRNQKSQKSA